MPSTETMQVRELYQTIPSAVVGIILCSFVQSATTSMAAVFGTAAGLSTQRIALFTSAAVVGAVLLQMPLGRLSDRHPRRAVILVVASIALGLALVGAVIPPTSILLIPLNLAFGAFVFPMYGQFVALANDWIAPQKRVAAASALILASSTGAVAAPVILGTAIELFGPGGYFLSLAAVLAVLVFYLGYRSQVREAVPLDRQSPFQPVLARSGAIAHSVSRWVRHPLAEWNRDAPTRKGDT